jgi:hypothetical protein
MSDSYLMGEVRKAFEAQAKAHSAKMAHFDRLDAVLAERSEAKRGEWDRELTRLDDAWTRATAVLLGVLESFLAARCEHGVRKDSVCRQCDPTANMTPRGGWNPKLGPPEPPPMPFKQFA